jgi:autotransporter translocation and assembly factor TamB
LAKGLRTRIAAGDALLGDTVTLTGLAQRNTAGELIVDQLTLAGAAAKLSGDARFDPASSRLNAALALQLPRLKPLGPALGTEMAGGLSARIDAEGVLDHLRLKGEVAGDDIAAGGTRIERLRLAGDVADLAEPKATLDGTYRAYWLDGALSLAAEAKGNSELVLPRFRLTAADGVIEGSLRIALDTYLTLGSINGRVPDLARWSKLAGTPLGGSLDFGGKFEDRRGQSLDLSLTGSRLAAGTASSRLGVGRIELIAKFADVLRAPSGMGRLSLASGTGEFTTATLALDAPRPGRFAFPGRGQRPSLDLGARRRWRARTGPNGPASHAPCGIAWASAALICRATGGGRISLRP